MHDHSHLLLHRNEGAAYVGLKQATMRVYDCTKKYDFHPVKIGRFVYYPRWALDKFRRERLSPTA